MSDNAPAKVVTMMNLLSVSCKVSANSNKLFVLLEPHSSFWFLYQLLTMTNFFEITVYLLFTTSTSDSVESDTNAKPQVNTIVLS